MSDQAPIVKATTPTKAKKSPAKSTAKSPKVGSAKKNASKTNSKGKSIAEHPTYVDMAMQAIKVLKERSGSSRQAVLKYIMSNYQVGSNAKQVNNQLKAALHRGVTKGLLKQSKGSGASGSFRVNAEGGKPAQKKKTPASSRGATSPKKAKNTNKKEAGEGAKGHSVTAKTTAKKVKSSSSPLKSKKAASGGAGGKSATAKSQKQSKRTGAAGKSTKKGSATKAKSSGANKKQGVTKKKSPTKPPSKQQGSAKKTVKKAASSKTPAKSKSQGKKSGGKKVGGAATKKGTTA